MINESNPSRHISPPDVSTMSPRENVSAVAINNYTLLRVLLALLVVFGHYKMLGAQTGWRFPFGYAEFAVQAFFVVSGYLIVASFDRSPQLLGFFTKRLFRIYPLYIVLVLVQAIIMACFLVDSPYSIMREFITYLGANIIFANFLKPEMGNLFDSVNGQGMNPSFWTLKIEVAFYLLLPLLHQAYKRWGWVFLALIFTASTVYFEVLKEYNQYELAKQLPGQLRFFVVGMAGYYFRDKLIVPSSIALVIAAVCFAIGPFNTGVAISIFHPILAGVFVHLVANCVRLPAFKLDISYGIYLLHAPLIQLALLTGLYQTELWFLFALLLVVIALAYVANKYIEEPGVALGHRLAKYFSSRSTPRNIPR